MKFVVAIFLMMGSFVAFGQTQNKKVLTEEQKIDYLINCVEQLKDAVFIRNGISYDASQAASHLRMKRAKAGKLLKTVDQFIDKVASESSMTGKPYKIKFANSQEIEAREFYKQCLKKLEQKK